jgi:hypothetical protein
MTVLSQLLDLHSQVRFTDVSLGIVDRPVCSVCHGVLDEPEDWDESTEGEWAFPLVQMAYPCPTRRLLLNLTEPVKE